MVFPLPVRAAPSTSLPAEKRRDRSRLNLGHCLEAHLGDSVMGRPRQVERRERYSLVWAEGADAACGAADDVEAGVLLGAGASSVTLDEDAVGASASMTSLCSSSSSSCASQLRGGGAPVLGSEFPAADLDFPERFLSYPMSFGINRPGDGCCCW